MEMNHEFIGSLMSVWRYPVKSMLGEELKSARVTERGLLGDRAYALLDRETGKVASAKNPRKWPSLFKFKAALMESLDPRERIASLASARHPRAGRVLARPGEHGASRDGYRGGDAA